VTDVVNAYDAMMPRCDAELLEVGSWKLEIGNWKLEIGSWKLVIGSWRQASDKAGLCDTVVCDAPRMHHLTSVDINLPFHIHIMLFLLLVAIY
jgi:hypothetical protein